MIGSISGWNAPGRQKSGEGTFPLPALTTLAPSCFYNPGESYSRELRSRLAHVATVTAQTLQKP